MPHARNSALVDIDLVDVSLGRAGLCAGAAGVREYRVTEQQQTACIGDVFRLCGSHIPNVTNIVACLKEQKPNLSPTCRVVFENDRSASRQRAAQPQRAAPQTEGLGALR